MRLKHRIPAAVLLATLILISACAGGPRQRPIPIGPVETGEGSLAAARKELQGSWALTSLDVIDASGGRNPVKANGALSFDAFSNLVISARIDDPRLEKTLPLDFTGRIVINPDKRLFYPADVEGAPDHKVDPKALGPVSSDKIRQYTVTGDTLVVTYLDAGGKPTAVTTWRRTSKGGL